MRKERLQLYDQTRFFTPKWLLERVERVGPIGLDPCGDYESNVCARHTVLHPSRGFELLCRHFDLPEIWTEGVEELSMLRALSMAGVEIADGLNISWFDRSGPGETVFVNPPYNKNANLAWGERMAGFGADLLDRHLIGLIPVSTGSKWWRHYWRANAICFLERRVDFDFAADAEKLLGFAPGRGAFDSAVPYWGPDVAAFVKSFSDVGEVITPRPRKMIYL